MNLIEINKVNDNLYIFNENISNKACITMALVIGNKRAAIIDTGYGITGDLDKIIKNITDKPIICLLTHCDPDHAGSASLFNKIYMNSLDEELLKSGSISVSTRLMSVKNTCDGNKDIFEYVKAHLVKKSTFQYINIKDGDIFDLGDCVLEAISFPGHSKGSMCFLNRKENYAITGDSIANVNSPVLFFGRCMSLSIYKENLERFIKITGDHVDLYTGHDKKPLKIQIIPEILALCEEVIAGNTANDIQYIPPFFKNESHTSNWLERKLKSIIIKFVSKKQLGSSVPLEHTKLGFIASIKYNANKI